ncbi:MAG: aspartate carbamoyltransferase [Victivallales bacterium]|nr:aspartate carbamoyltransferase [Victivallales bacterium]MBT7164005.1 aspartate carbamoyltransferase [Victivallales bacterium]
MRPKRLDNISWEQFKALSLEEKGPYFRQKNGNPYHVLVAQQFDRESLDHVCRMATRIRRIAKSKEGMIFLSNCLCHKRAMLDFSQPSSRTFLSFFAACQILGLKVGEVRDPTTSSEMKGESREDSVRTFSSYFDLIVMRTPIQGFAEKMAWILSNAGRPVPILNAGSGKDQHPTQALLDIYTLERSFEREGGIDGKDVVFVGDLARGRTVRSLACLLTHYSGVKQHFVAPDELQIGDDVLAQLRAAGVEYEVTSDFESVIPKADAIYMTRIQDEWDKDGESPKVDISDYYFSAEHLKLLKFSAILMHPLPRRQEIDPAVDSDPRAMYWRQVRNGMWVRAALISIIFARDDEISDYYKLNLR